jgi:hypothetical protein
MYTAGGVVLRCVTCMCMVSSKVGTVFLTSRRSREKSRNLQLPRFGNGSDDFGERKKERKKERKHRRGLRRCWVRLHLILG